MLDEIESKTVIKMKKVIDRGKRQCQVKPVENINKNFSRDKSCTKGSPSFT